ncbi:MAG TPA: DUF5682 family protein [Gemmatales bacterium]|nr:DUF5682 family protein [Gemmatales bacterium]
MSWHVLGIRHHGPGCTRSLLTALDEIKPDVIVMEGPADAEEILSQAGHEQMKPPVAMLLYPPDEPRRGVYYPLAEFSPEWQAMQWALKNKITIRLMDLPQTMQLAKQTEDGNVGEGEAPAELSESESQQQEEEEPHWRTDPIAVLAEAAGFADHELWWEQQVERRDNATGLFQAILEAMSAVRQEYPQAPERDLLREAHMRQVLRGVRKELFPNIVVICGAYHAPVLTQESLDSFPIKDDAARLKGLPKTKTLATWIPWSHSRLSFRSGYGAGMQSPGWYSHIWQARDAAPLHFMTGAARLLRGADLDASSASVIESLRLADALAAIRDLRSPGLTELNEAILTVLCHGNTSPLKLIHDRLEVGDVIGEVPDDSASVPIARDLEQQQKTLRLKRTTEIKTLDLDLRKDNDLARSALFHRLDLLGIEWAVLQPQQMAKSSTFHEYWQLTWKPELAVEIIDANLWGSTVEQAAANKTIDSANKATDVAVLSQLLNKVLLAQLDAVVPVILSLVQNRAAASTDVQQLMQAVPALTRIARYSDVRQTQADQVLPILEGLLARIFVGLLPACSSLDDDAAKQMTGNIDGVQQSLELLQRQGLLDAWLVQLHHLMSKDVHGLLRGRCCRILLEKGRLGDEEFHRVCRLALSTVNEPSIVAAWATGLLQGSGMVLIHQDELWRILDRWLIELPETTFIEMVPLIRRAFADFTGPERRAMGEKVKHINTVGSSTKQVSATDKPNINLERARLVLPVLKHILGIESK